MTTRVEAAIGGCPAALARAAAAAPWAPPPMRHEAHFGDRTVRCFSERPRSVYALLAEAAARRPDGEALVCGGERLSWRELEARCAALAGGLAQRGIGKGERVALLLGNRIEFVVALFALARLGAVAVPIGTRSKAPELAYLLAHSGASLLLHEDELSGELPPAPARICMGAAAGSEPFAALAALAGAAPAPVAAVDEEDLAVLIYTSGTTGKPKGAMVTQLNLVHAAMVYETCMGLGGADRSLCAVPLSHITGLAALLATVARCAGTLVLMPAFKAADFLELAGRERISHSLLVPAMYNLLLLHPDFTPARLPAWRIGGFGGAPMPAATLRRLADVLPALRLINAYGASETVAALVMSPSAAPAEPQGTVGQLVPGAELLVMDEQGRECGPGESGELWLSGPTVVRGYWNNPLATAESFQGGFWRSGDIGSIDAEGRVGVHDRRKDMLNRGGYKIYSVEVENVLAEHPAVVESAVVARPCPVLGERVHAFVVLRDPAVDAAVLKAHCSARLSDYKVPETYSLCSEPLPRNANGKLLKRELRERID